MPSLPRFPLLILFCIFPCLLTPLLPEDIPPMDVSPDTADRHRTGRTNAVFRQDRQRLLLARRIVRECASDPHHPQHLAHPHAHSRLRRRADGVRGHDQPVALRPGKTDRQRTDGEAIREEDTGRKDDRGSGGRRAGNKCHRSVHSQPSSASPEQRSHRSSPCLPGVSSTGSLEEE